uniref:Thrombopoietin n=1 Tax=Takifugu rubripes TaxID=31033 RepID=A0A3B5JX47_TAKRU
MDMEIRLLLLCVVASEVWDAETKPIEFVCHKGMRRSLNIAADMERRSCNGSMMLSTPVQLPCVELHLTSWQNQTVRHQEKRGDILASLRLLSESVKAARASDQPPCSASVLLRLENNINNYQLIVTNLQLSVSRTKMELLLSPKLGSGCLIGHLISGKLERFMVELKDRCP